MSWLEDAIDVVAVAVGVYFGQTWLVALGAADYNSRHAKESATNTYNDQLKDRLQMVKSAVEPRKIVYGRSRVSGPLIYVGNSGSKKEFLHLVVCLAGHECDAIETVYFNDIALPDGDSGPADGYIMSGDYFKGSTATAGLSRSGNGTVTIPVAFTRIVGVTYNAGDGGSHAYNVSCAYTLAGNVVTVTGCPHSYQTVNVTYEYATGSPLVRIRKVMGTATQAAFSELIAESGGAWTSAHQLKGICALYVRIQYDQDVFGQIGLPNISAVVRGKKVWDPRTSTTAWSSNPALCVADYLQSYLGATWPTSTPMLWYTSSGALMTWTTSTGAPVTWAGPASTELVDQANICDQPVVIDGSMTTEARYMCNGALSTDAIPRDNLTALLETMAGSAVWVQGRWLIRAGAARSSALTITEDVLADGVVQISAFAARQSLINRIVPTYCEPAKTWATMESPPVTNSAYLGADGGIDLPLAVTYSMCIGSITAQRLAKIRLDRSRQSMTVKINCSLRAYDVVPTDWVTVTLARYGWSSKLFEVVERDYDPINQQVALTLQETAAGVYDWAYGMATVVDLTPNTVLPNPLTLPAALAGLTAASGTAQLQRLGDGTVITRALVSWAASNDTFVATSGGRIDVQWQMSGDTTWTQSPGALGTETSCYIGPLPDVGAIYIRARAMNSWGRAGPWNTIGHFVVGKSEAPSDVAGVAARVVAGSIVLSWTPCLDADYAETEIRQGADWASGTLVYVGSMAQFVWPWPAVGTYNLLFANRDTSNNVSATAAVFAITVNNDGTISYPGGSGVYFIGTGNISDNAATDVLSTTATGISVTGIQAAGTAGGSWSSIGTIYYTPAVSGIVVLNITGEMNVQTATSGTVGLDDWAYARTCVTYTDTTLNRQIVMQEDVGFSKSITRQFAQTMQFTVVAGVAYSFQMVGQKFGSGSTVTVNYISMRMEMIKK